MLIGESACRTTFSIRSNRLGHTTARPVGDGRCEPELTRAMIDAVLFDLDETLLDRTNSLKAFLRDQFARHADHLGQVRLEEWSARFLVLDRRGHVRKSVVYPAILGEFGGRAEHAGALLADYRARCARFAQPFDGMKAVLKELRARGLARHRDEWRDRVSVEACRGARTGWADRRRPHLGTGGITKAGRGPVSQSRDGLPDRAVALLVRWRQSRGRHSRRTRRWHENRLVPRSRRVAIRCRAQPRGQHRPAFRGFVPSALSSCAVTSAEGTDQGRPLPTESV